MSKPVPTSLSRLRRVSLLGLGIACLGIAGRAQGAQGKPGSSELRFANVFGDHAVLQRDRPVSLFGFGAVAGGITVTLQARNTIEVRGTVDENGRWSVQLPAQAARATPSTVIVRQGGREAKLQDVLFGEVWVTSGQSNMVWGMSADTEWEMERECADFPLVRYCETNRFTDSPQADLSQPMKWFPLQKDQKLGGVSAVSYYFATRLHRYLGVPVGIVSTAVGGTMVESWTSRQTLERVPEVADYLRDYEQRLASWPAERTRRQTQYEQRKAKAQADGKKPPRRPNLSPPNRDRNQPAGCYNASVAPLRGLTIRGAIFLQGENNSIGRWNAYAATLPHMIADWRVAFGQPKLPFGLISLQGFGPHGHDLAPAALHVAPGTFYYAAIRDAQFRVSKATPGVDWITTYDTGDTANIHPARKRTVGQRTARWALATVYDKPVVHRGPHFDSATFTKSQGNRTGTAQVRFSLDPRARKNNRDPKPIWYLDWPISREGKPYRGFLLAGADRHFWPANARRSKDRGVLILDSPHVPDPVAVRYGWSGFPEGNVVGAEHLPLAPFRSDNWPLGADRPYEAEARKQWSDSQRAQRQAAERTALADRLAIAAQQLEEVQRKATSEDKQSTEQRKQQLAKLRAELKSLHEKLSPRHGQDR